MGNEAQRGRRLAAGRGRHPAVHIAVFIHMGVFGAQRRQLFTQHLCQHKLFFRRGRSARHLAGLCVIRRIAAKTFHCTHGFSSFPAPARPNAGAQGGLFFDGSTPQAPPSRHPGRTFPQAGRRPAARSKPAPHLFFILPILFPEYFLAPALFRKHKPAGGKLKHQHGPCQKKRFCQQRHAKKANKISCIHGVAGKPVGPGRVQPKAARRGKASHRGRTQAKPRQIANCAPQNHQAAAGCT